MSPAEPAVERPRVRPMASARAAVAGVASYQKLRKKTMVSRTSPGNAMVIVNPMS
jgi:hypothetical protein